MNNAAAPAELPREYLWAFPGAPIRIHLKLAVVSRLRDHLLKGSNPDPALCRERGGLLLGTVRTNNVEITDFEPFRPDRLERHYVLSGSEKELLRMTLENRPRSSQTSVVGYFRSDFRGGVQLRPEDLAVARQFFSHPAQVFLVVRADKEGPPDAGFFFWDGGEIFGDATFMQFPFDEKLLPAQEPVLSPPEKPAAQARPGTCSTRCPTATPTAAPTFRALEVLILGGRWTSNSGPACRRVCASALCRIKTGNAPHNPTLPHLRFWLRRRHCPFLSRIRMSRSPGTRKSRPSLTLESVCSRSKTVIGRLRFL